MKMALVSHMFEKKKQSNYEFGLVLNETYSETNIQPFWQLVLSNLDHHPRESTMFTSYTLNTSACFKIIEKIIAARTIKENNATRTPI